MKSKLGELSASFDSLTGEFSEWLLSEKVGQKDSEFLVFKGIYFDAEQRKGDLSANYL